MFVSIVLHLPFCVIGCIRLFLAIVRVPAAALIFSYYISGSNGITSSGLTWSWGNILTALGGYVHKDIS